MILLDTDTLSIYQNPVNPETPALRARIAAVPRDELIGTTIITYEEQTRGWIGYVAKARTSAAQLLAYERLQRHLDYWRDLRTIAFDAAAIAEFERLKSLRLLVGTSDLKIAAIALRQRAKLVSRNLKDFRKVPGLIVEDWTVPEPS